VTKIPSVRTRLFIIVDYYTPRDYERWLFLLFCLIYLRIGKKKQWIEKNGGTGVRWDGLERPLTRRRRIIFTGHFLLVHLKFEHPLIKTQYSLNL
jgi:hypothetical protein